METQVIIAELDKLSSEVTEMKHLLGDMRTDMRLMVKYLRDLHIKYCPAAKSFGSADPTFTEDELDKMDEAETKAAKIAFNKVAGEDVFKV